MSGLSDMERAAMRVDESMLVTCGAMVRAAELRVLPTSAGPLRREFQILQRGFPGALLTAIVEEWPGHGVSLRLTVEGWMESRELRPTDFHWLINPLRAHLLAMLSWAWKRRPSPPLKRTGPATEAAGPIPPARSSEALRPAPSSGETVAETPGDGKNMGPTDA